MIHQPPAGFNLAGGFFVRIHPTCGVAASLKRRLAKSLIDISYPLAYNCGAIFHLNLEA